MGPNACWAKWTTDGRQWATICVATAKSEDGFRKAQQLTEEATETSLKYEAVGAESPLRKTQKPGHSRTRGLTEPINVLEPLDLW